jgi:hypothetical protein
VNASPDALLEALRSMYVPAHLAAHRRAIGQLLASADE